MKRENNQAIYASWETGTNKSEEYDDIALMAIEDSQPENDADTKEKKVHISDLKDNPKKKLSSLMVTHINIIQEQNNDKNQLVAYD